MKTEVVIREGEALLAASDETSFVFEVTGLTDAQADLLGTVGEISERIGRICEMASLEYRSVGKGSFKGNMIYLDSRMDELLADMLVDFSQTGISDCKALVERLEKRNPFARQRSGSYEYKFRKFLYSVVLGMTPLRVWDGCDKGIARYSIVKENGDVVAYHIYNRDAFETYLLNNTRLERASTTRHGYASLYRGEDGKMYLNLNLQIRFI